MALSFSIAAQYTFGILYPFSIMSYTAELEGSITAAPIVAERQPALGKTSFAPEVTSENASTTE